MRRARALLDYLAKILKRGPIGTAIGGVMRRDASVRRRHGWWKLSKQLCARGEERTLLDGLWVKVPTYLNAKRLLVLS